MLRANMKAAAPLEFAIERPLDCPLYSSCPTLDFLLRFVLWFVLSDGDGS
jgi:hypothetical protein